MIIKLTDSELTQAVGEFLQERYGKYQESLVVNYVCITDKASDEQHVEVEAFFEKVAKK